MAEQREKVPTLVERVAYLLWQVNEGYVLPEDRAIGTNWFTEPVEDQHPDDQAERPGWIDLAETVIAAVKAEIEAPPTGRSSQGGRSNG